MINNLNELDNSELIKFIGSIDRYERLRDPVVYCKAIRCTLLALGYDSDFVENRFRDLLDTCFIYD